MQVYEPLSYFIPLLNFRALSLITLATVLFISATRIQKTGFSLPQYRLVDGMRVLGVATIFLFLTIDTNDIFEKKLQDVAAINPANRNEMEELYRNMKQLSISAIWLLYSMILMVIGIYRSNFNIRIASIVIFGITIAKVFFYDLSYLDTLHRIFSFIGLGVILLLVSYLYRRFKDLILKKE
jgi:uncharacterized membrane protein